MNKYKKRRDQKTDEQYQGKTNENTKVPSHSIRMLLERHRKRKQNAVAHVENSVCHFYTFSEWK